MKIQTEKEERLVNHKNVSRTWKTGGKKQEIIAKNNPKQESVLYQTLTISAKLDNKLGFRGKNKDPSETSRTSANLYTKLQRQCEKARILEKPQKLGQNLKQKYQRLAKTRQEHQGELMKNQTQKEEELVKHKEASGTQRSNAKLDTKVGNTCNISKTK